MNTNISQTAKNVLDKARHLALMIRYESNKKEASKELIKYIQLFLKS